MNEIVSMPTSNFKTKTFNSSFEIDLNIIDEISQSCTKNRRRLNLDKRQHTTKTNKFILRRFQDRFCADIRRPPDTMRIMIKKLYKDIANEVDNEILTALFQQIKQEEK